MRSHTFHVRLDPNATREEAHEQRLATRLFFNQVTAGHLLATLYETVRDIEGVKTDATRDLMETRLTRINRNGKLLLDKLIELHNERSDLCVAILKEKK